MDWRRRLRERRVRREERVRRVAPVRKMVRWLRERVVEGGCCCGGFGLDIVGRDWGWRNAMRRCEVHNGCWKRYIVRGEVQPYLGTSTRRIIFSTSCTGNNLIPSTKISATMPRLSPAVSHPRQWWQHRSGKRLRILVFIEYI